MKKKCIAIDGPAGAGKSTVARLTAERLGYIYVDTGAMYRALTYKAMSLGLPLDDGASLEALARETEISLEAKGREQRVTCDGQDVTNAIRDPEVSQNVSQVALVPGVRVRMVELQQAMAKGGGVVMDGRDIGSQVLPNADCKFFLTASVEERASRRCRELKDKGYPAPLEEVKEDIARRDATDSQRAVSPLVRVADAVLIDSTCLTVNEVVDAIVAQCGGSD